MEKKNFWSEACKYGAIIGTVMAVSHVLEQSLILQGKMSMYMLMLIEWIVAAVLFVYLLYRYTKRRSAEYSAEEGFTFGQGFGFIVAMSVLSGIIVGVVGYVFLHAAIGYENYVQKFSESVSGMLSMGNVPASIENTYAAMIDQIQNTPAPSIFSALWSRLSSYLISGGIVGLIIAGIVSRAPRPFGEGTDE